MKRKQLAAFALGLLVSLPLWATEVAGVKFEDKLSDGGNELVLNGAGLRKKLVFKVYAMGLYLPARAGTPGEILNGKGARKIQIVTLRDLTADQLAEALEKGVEENSTALELAKIRDRLNEFRATLISMQKIPEKSAIRIDWTGNETRVFVNGMQQGKDIAGADFFQALLRIWIGEKPAQDDLKEALLGKAH